VEKNDIRPFRGPWTDAATAAAPASLSTTSIGVKKTWVVKKPTLLNMSFPHE